MKYSRILFNPSIIISFQFNANEVMLKAKHEENKKVGKNRKWENLTFIQKKRNLLKKGEFQRSIKPDIDK